MTRATSKGKAQNVNWRKKAPSLCCECSEEARQWKACFAREKKEAVKTLFCKSQMRLWTPLLLRAMSLCFLCGCYQLSLKFTARSEKQRHLSPSSQLSWNAYLSYQRHSRAGLPLDLGGATAILSTLSPRTLVKFQSPIHLRCVFHPSPFILVASRGKVISFVLVRCALVIAVCCMKTALSYSL